MQASRGFDTTSFRAGGGDRTHDLTITNRLRYHCATPAGPSPRIGGWQPCGQPARSTLLPDHLDVGRLCQVTDDSTPPSATPTVHAGGLDTTRAVLLAIAFVVVAVIALSSLTSSDGSKPNGPASAVTTTTVARAHQKNHPAVNRSEIQVQVANGTATAGVATSVTATLQEQGWSTLPPVNASSTAPSSTVYFAGGRRAAGLQMAKDLKLPASVVQPLTTSVPVPGANGDDLVVLVGPDLNGAG